MDFENDIIIDEDSLDLEWLEQPALALSYGRYYAEKKKELLLAEENIKLIRSELIRAANSDPEDLCGKVKPTAGDIEAYYRNHKRHKEAKTELIELRYELDIAEIAKNEISYSRKSALENLVKLHGQNYFAGPKVPRNIHSERAEKKEKSQKAANNTVAAKMKRSK